MKFYDWLQIEKIRQGTGCPPLPDRHPSVATWENMLMSEIVGEYPNNGTWNLRMAQVICRINRLQK